MSVELQGFATATLANIVLELNTDLPVDVTLQLERVQESLTVTAEATMVRTKQSDLAVQIDTRTIDSIPLNGRQFLDLVALAPGVASRPQQSDQGANITVFGERSITSSFLVDGLDNNDLFSRDFSEFFIQDAIQEFKVLLAGYQAEFGKASGAITNVVTRSGSNAFHGRGFLFARDNGLDSSNIAGQKPQELKRVETGGTVGGPIRKDRTFFFDAFQFFREKRGLNFDQSVIPPIISDGYFTPSIGKEPFDQSPTDKRYTNFVRVDHQFNPQNQLFITSNVNRSTSRNYIPRPDRGFAAPPPGTLVLPSISSDLDINTASVNGRYTTFLGPTTLLESSARVSRYSYAENDAKPKGAEQIFPITFAPAFFIWMSNASPIGQLDREETRFQWTENFSYSKGRHNFKAGLDLDRTHLDNYFLSANEIILGNTALDTNYKTLGYQISMQRFIEPIVSGNDHAVANNTNISLFAQDSWEAAPNLTLNLGLRYDYATLFSDAKRNISPRIGFSYDVGGTGRTVVRGGLGRFYDQTILEAVVQTPELGGVQYGSFDMQVIPRGGAFYNNPAIGAYGPLQDSGTRWLSNPLYYSYLIPNGDVRTAGNISITGKGQPYIVYNLLGIPVSDPKNPPVLSFASIPTLTGGRLTAQQALNILNTAFPGPSGPQFDFLPETGSNSINAGRPLLFKFRQLQQEISTIQTVQHSEETPYTDSFNLGMERALTGDVSVDTQVFIRRSRNLLARHVINLLPVPIS